MTPVTVSNLIESFEQMDDDIKYPAVLSLIIGVMRGAATRPDMPSDIAAVLLETSEAALHVLKGMEG